jgi:hypothetical protein
MKLEVSAPTRLAEVIAELASGAVVVWTRATSAGDAGLGARTVVHLDGDVTTTITPACLSHPRADELFQRHDQEMQKVGALLQAGTAQGKKLITVVAATLAVVMAAADIATGHSWLRVLAATVGVVVGSVGVHVTGLARRISSQLLLRGVRRAIAKRRTAQRPPAGP